MFHKKRRHASQTGVIQVVNSLSPLSMWSGFDSRLIHMEIWYLGEIFKEISISSCARKVLENTKKNEKDLDD